MFESFVRKTIAFLETTLQRTEEQDKYRSTIRELSALSDKDLYDIGISRGDIEAVARGLITRDYSAGESRWVS
jgi:uncharacterized protein YjiS (DUF1127 family)